MDNASCETADKRVVFLQIVPHALHQVKHPQPAVGYPCKHQDPSVACCAVPGMPADSCSTAGPINAAFIAFTATSIVSWGQEMPLQNLTYMHTAMLLMRHQTETARISKPCIAGGNWANTAHLLGWGLGEALPA